jgi:phosphoglycolate phosphatase
MLHRHLDHYGYDSGTDCAWMIGDNSKDMEAPLKRDFGVFAGWGFSAQGEGDYFAASPQSLVGYYHSKGKL